MNHAQFWGGAAGGYEIDNSLRWRGSSSIYLSQSVNSAPTTSTSATLSFWMKASQQNNGYKLFDCRNGSTDWGLSGGIKYVSGFGWGDATFGSAENATGVTNYWTLNQNSSQPALRDPSAWYHVVIIWDGNNGTSTRRMQVYVNGSQSYFYNYSGSIASGRSCPWTRNGYTLKVGGSSNSQFYMAECHCVDGQVLAPTDFGEFDDNGVWRPIAYTGSYGTNGFYLKFDPSATNGIGHDHSGNGNNFTPTGFTTSGTGTDVMSDTPTNNFATLNAVDHSTQNVPTSFNEANLQVAHRSGTGNYSLAVSTIAFDSDDSDGFYFESIATDYVANSYQSVCLINAAKTVQEFIGNAPVGSSTGSTFGIGWESTSGYLRNFGSNIAGWDGTTTWTTDGDILMVFVKNNKVYLGKNGTWLRSANPSTESNPAITLPSSYKLKPGTAGKASAKQSFNFGQRAFSYTPPTGAKTLCTANLPAPDIADGSQYFDTKLYTGSGGSQSLTGLGFQPELVWIKARSTASSHGLYDAVRGVGKVLLSNGTFAEQNYGSYGVTSFNAAGFSVNDLPGYGVNQSGVTYAAWAWDAGGTGSSNTSGSITSTVSANPSAGFSIATYTGNGTVGATVGHGLGVAPKMIIVKRRNATGNWFVYHEDLHPTIPGDYYIVLQTTAARVDSGTAWNNTEPTSTTFMLGTNSSVNANNGTYVAYCFAEVEGYSKFGSYLGNANNDGPFVYLGFRPALILTKRMNSTSNWVIQDSTRQTYNPSDAWLRPNTADTEGTTNPDLDLDFLSNGFKVRNNGTDNNISGSTYIFAAFAEHPFGGSGVSPATAR